MSDHGHSCTCDSCMADPRNAKIAELTNELARQAAACESFRLGMLDRESHIAELEDECHAWADRMAASETANLNRIAELETLLQRVLRHGPIVPIQLAAAIMAAGITRSVRGTEAKP